MTKQKPPLARGGFLARCFTAFHIRDANENFFIMTCMPAHLFYGSFYNEARAVQEFIKIRLQMPDR